MSGGCRKKVFFVYATSACALMITDCGLDLFKGNKLDKDRMEFNAFMSASWPVSLPVSLYIVTKSAVTGKKFTFTGQWSWSKTTIVDEKN